MRVFFIPILSLPTDSAAASVATCSTEWSSTTPRPSGRTPRTNVPHELLGLQAWMWCQGPSDLCVGADANHISEGFLQRGLRKPPVPHLRKLSCTLPSRGLRRAAKVPTWSAASRYSLEIPRERFRSISPSHGHDKANDFPPPF